MTPDDWDDDGGEWTAAEIPRRVGWLLAGGVALCAWLVY